MTYEEPALEFVVTDDVDVITVSDQGYDGTELS